MKRLGLVGGISWVSTLEYDRLINEGVNDRLGDLHAAECVIQSLDFGEVMSAGWDNAFPALLEACRRLEAGGAEGLVLCANTAHLHADRLQDEVSLPMIHSVDATAAEVRRLGVSKVGVLATSSVMGSTLYPRRLGRLGIEVIMPDRQASRDRIQHILRDELGRGLFREDSKQVLLQEMSALSARGAEGIVLACTEIPLIISQDDLDAPLFDTM